MADEVHHPHDHMVHAVLRDPTEATSFLQAHLPQDVSQGLNWATLRLHDRSFVDEDLRESESDLLYEVEYASGDETIWIYCLVEHQSTPDRWMRFRLLKYCCRIWDVNLEERPTPNELRLIVPLVFYQGERTWLYSTEFADLFAEAVRDWPGVPRVSHGLIDQSGMRPEEVQGELKARLMQLLLMAAYHPERPWRELVAELLVSLSSMPPSGGINYVRVFVRYILSTQEPEAAQSFREVLRRQAPGLGDDLMTYAQELEEQGKMKERLTIIENLLRLGEEWPRIEEITGVNESHFEALKQQIANMNMTE